MVHHSKWANERLNQAGFVWANDMPADRDKPVNLPVHEQRINRAKARALAKQPATTSSSTQPSQSTATPSNNVVMTTRSQRGAPEMTYYSDRPPQRVFRRPQIKQIPVPSLPGQEDIPSSDDNFFSRRPTRVSNAVPTQPASAGPAPVESVTLDTATSGDLTSARVEDTNKALHFSQPSTTTTHAHPFGPPYEPQNDLYSAPPAVADEDTYILPSVNANPFDFSNANWNNMMFSPGVGELGGPLGTYSSHIGTQDPTILFNAASTYYPSSIPDSSFFHLAGLPTGPSNIGNFVVTLEGSRSVQSPKRLTIGLLERSRAR
ncbi:hypothetical protein BDV93DRAFT_515791 [Ceratobasidium sp. AG-I]|nr:hypothetical protein BDV93DRAFT_515791 [Ceratobasidium sp. AG-I]